MDSFIRLFYPQYTFFLIQWDLLLVRYNESVRCIEDIREICDEKEFEALCQRNLAADSGQIRISIFFYYDFVLMPFECGFCPPGVNFEAFLRFLVIVATRELENLQLLRENGETKKEDLDMLSQKRMTSFNLKNVLKVTEAMEEFGVTCQHEEKWLALNRNGRKLGNCLDFDKIVQMDGKISASTLRELVENALR